MASFVYRCPQCRGKFSWSKDLPEPKVCPLPNCDYAYAERDDNVIYMPALISAQTKSVDSVGRSIMDGSVQRQEMAAQLAGTSVEDMASLKITNLNDRNDTMFAAPEASNPVSQSIQQMQRNGFSPWQGANGVAYSGGTTQGAEPNKGLRTQLTVRDHHAQISKGSAVSDRPALEISNPLYRRRI
jgi:hypothetical protein